MKILFIITWFVIGLVVSLYVLMSCYRGQSYDFVKEDVKGIDDFLLIILILGFITIGGYISGVITMIFLIQKKELYIKLIYKIANIGIRKK